MLWKEAIQSAGRPWGFSGIGVEHPIGTTVEPDDANGANLSRVSDPAGGTGYALRHFGTLDQGGSRSQLGIYGDVNTAFGRQAKTPEGVWVAQEWYFPEAVSAAGDRGSWVNLWDWHSVDADRRNRWHTAPGLMLARDGSMRVGWEWGAPARAVNPSSDLSTMTLPVGRWFDVEMHYVWSPSPTATLSLWVDGQLALEQHGVQTRAPSHAVVETYSKLYGSAQGRASWSPTPTVRYTRNLRVAGHRIWQ
ncbi:MAG: heparin lyase I family protein [Candidatus Latescibacterota bacterium]